MTTTIAQPTTAAVHTEQLTKVYGQGDTRVVALDHVTVDFRRGQFTAIMGPSGSGKSTLMHCAAGLDTPSEGRVVIGRVDTTTLNDKALTLLRRRRIGFIFQSFNLLPTMSARENILLPLKLAHVKPDEEWFTTIVTVLGLTERLGHRPGELSGGQAQRVAIARALVSSPRAIFADEPSGALDQATGHEMMQLLTAAVSMAGATLVVVTHDLNVARWCSRLIEIRDGLIHSDRPLAVDRSREAEAIR